jgi:hypothetical protein
MNKQNKVYFILNKAITDKYGCPKNRNGNRHWKLSCGGNETFLFYTLANSWKAANKALHEFVKLSGSYAICEGLVKQEDMCEGLRAALVGDVICDVPVKITKMDWIDVYV